MANNLTLGRGELWFSAFKPGTFEPEGERYFGNTPEAAFTIESETLDHFDSDHGVKEKDESVPLSTNRSGSFITDNISPENVALFFFGSTTALTVTGITVTAEQVNGVIPGLTYQLGVSPTAPSGVRALDPATVPTVTDDATPTPATYALGADFKINNDLGRLEVVKGGAITTGKNLRLGYKTLTSTRPRIISGSNPISGTLRYIAFNPVGDNFDWFMPYVKLTPNGDYALKGEEWQQIPFTVEMLKRPGLEALYIDGRPYIPTP